MVDNNADIDEATAVLTITALRKVVVSVPCTPISCSEHSSVLIDARTCYQTKPLYQICMIHAGLAETGAKMEKIYADFTDFWTLSLYRRCVQLTYLILGTLKTLVYCTVLYCVSQILYAVTADTVCCVWCLFVKSTTLNTTPYKQPSCNRPIN